MDISVIICTYNRSKSLKRTLGSVAELSMPSNLKWELIVVDNNSKDDTKVVVERFRKKSGLNIRYVFEEKQGLSFARNRGVEEANGQILAFTDDDVYVDKYWLKNIALAFQEYDVACVGGKILPIWEQPKPKWLSGPYFYAYLALLDHGNTPFYLDNPHIWGANLAVRSSIFEKYGQFSTSLGRVGNKLYGGEETAFIRKLLSAGEKVLYSPSVIVHHFIPADRMTKSYFRKWRFYDGERKANLLAEYSSRNLMGLPYYAIRSFISDLFTYFFSVITSDKNAFVCQLRLAETVGFLVGRLLFCRSQCK